MAETLAGHLKAAGNEVVIFDGDAVRTGVSADLGFSRDHRHANALRVASAARRVVEQGGIAICALVSPYRESRARAREVVGSERFLEVHVDTPLATCESRDVKGMYRLAHAGKIEHFTGVSDPYEPPIDPELRVTGVGSVDDVVTPILALIAGRSGDSISAAFSS